VGKINTAAQTFYDRMLFVHVFCEKTGALPPPPGQRIPDGIGKGGGIILS
jgi:hypothetical protein